MAVIGEFLGSDGVGERDDEAEEVGAGGGGVEAEDVVLGLDDFGGDLEGEGGREGDNGLGFWDRGEEDGFFGAGVGGGEHLGGGADGDVGGRGVGRRRGGGEGGGSAAVDARGGGVVVVEGDG